MDRLVLGEIRAHGSGGHFGLAFQADVQGLGELTFKRL